LNHRVTEDTERGEEGRGERERGGGKRRERERDRDREIQGEEGGIGGEPIRVSATQSIPDSVLALLLLSFFSPSSLLLLAFFSPSSLCPL